MKIQHICGIQTPSHSWTNLIKWAAQKWQDSSFPTMIQKLSLVATVYYIWYERNERYHHNNNNSVITIVERIVELVKLKLSTIRRVLDYTGNRNNQVRWNLPDTIFDM